MFSLHLIECLVAWTWRLPLQALWAASVLEIAICAGCSLACAHSIRRLRSEERWSMDPLLAAAVELQGRRARRALAGSAAANALAWGLWLPSPPAWESSNWARGAWFMLAWAGLVASAWSAAAAREARLADRPGSEDFDSRSGQVAARLHALACDEESRALNVSGVLGEPRRHGGPRRL